MKSKRLCFRWLLVLTLSLLIVSACEVSNGFAGSKIRSRKEFSRDFKMFPKGTPEAVLTAMVEADLGDIYNRGDDDRFPLWWGLTEDGGVPDNDGYLKLYIQSYKIGDRVVDKTTSDQILNLHMDVRAVWLGCGQKDTQNLCWRTVPVLVEGHRYTTTSQEFIQTVLGKSSLPSGPDYYAVSKGKTTWVFPVRMKRKNGEWLISNDSLPFQSAYVWTLIQHYKEEIGVEVAKDRVCTGERKIDSLSMKGELEYMRQFIGNDLKKYKSKFCNKSDFEARANYINMCNSIINILRSALSN